MIVATQEGVFVLNEETGRWERAIPMPYPHRFFPWLWRRLTGWRDTYGRKAVLWKPWEL